MAPAKILAVRAGPSPQNIGCETCADCSTPDPEWASVNRCVLICDECVTVHRSLGRHISQVKHLKKSTWHPWLIAMVNSLAGSGSANALWEHSLLLDNAPSVGVQTVPPIKPAAPSGSSTLPNNSSAKEKSPWPRKPNPRDNPHTTKADFIKVKYQTQAFVRKIIADGGGDSGASLTSSFKAGSSSSPTRDLSAQLHSCVRTENLETCLRLLALGADPNFVHPERGNMPIHVAVKAGQHLQVELLVVYGADPGALDSSGKSPVEVARDFGHAELAERLVEMAFELTDRLTFFLCGRKPDHSSGQHFIIPDVPPTQDQVFQPHSSLLDHSEFAKAARKKLQALSNHLFEELAMDVYDEVDRRETDDIWLSLQNSVVNANLVLDGAVPFLPVNQELSATRNQGRQKLARFNKREFSTLILDILTDAKRRQLGLPPPLQLGEGDGLPRWLAQDHLAAAAASRGRDQTMESDGVVTLESTLEEPIYDAVAEDEDSYFSMVAHVNGVKNGGDEELLVSSGVGGVMAMSGGGGANATSWAENVITSLMNVGADEDDGPASSLGGQRSQTVAANHAGTFPRVNASATGALCGRPASSLTAALGKKGAVRSSRRTGANDDEDYDEPLYDSVASDEESNADALSLGTKMSEESRRSAASRPRTSVKLLEAEDFSNADSVTIEKYVALKEALTLSDTRVQQLLVSNRELKQEIVLLQNMVRKLMHENVALRKMKGLDTGISIPQVCNEEQFDDYAHIETAADAAAAVDNPSPSNANDNSLPPPDRSALSPPRTSSSTPTSRKRPPPLTSSRQPGASPPQPRLLPTEQEHPANDSGIRVSAGGASDYDNASPTDSCHLASPVAEGAKVGGTTTTPAAGTFDAQIVRRDSHEYLPREEDVVRKTEKITRKIQELLLAAQDGREAAYGPCAEKIYLAVRDMAALFPQRPESDAICEALHALTGSAARLQVQCHDHALASAGLLPESASKSGAEESNASMTASMTSTNSAAAAAPYTQAVIQCAYEIAKAAKKLVTEFQ